MDNSYNKYLKYKTKYLELKQKIDMKNQTGGMGSKTQYWNQHPDFIEINDISKSTVVLLNNYNGTSQYSLYSPLLDNLLRINNGVINMDFIMNFHRHIYYDLDGSNLGLKNNRWINEPANKYNIVNFFIQQHRNTSIYFLQNKTDERDKKVLKVFNNINLETTGLLSSLTRLFTTPTKTPIIDDYLSLEIYLIKNDPGYFESFQKNYVVYSKEKFDSINFNMIQNLIESQEGHLYLSSKNNDAINDYIINLILQKVNETESIHFVNYHNLFVTKVNDDLKYCILMDMFDGSLNNFIEELKMDSNDIINKLLVDIERDLNILKKKEYLFTHTDMKLENIFYKKEGDNIIPYIADFDKSSISFHNIRFYNNIESSGLLKGITAPTNFIGSLIATDKYTTDHTRPRIESYNTNTTFKYRLSRILKRGQFYVGLNGIESEQLYMRYNCTPYYTSFDMCSLICSLFNKKKITMPNDKTPLYQLLIKYIDKDYLLTIFKLYNEVTLKNPEDFGELMTQLLIRDDLQGDYFINTFVKTESAPFINKLYKSLNENKIVLTIPFVPLSIQKKLGNNNITIFQNNKDRTESLYTILLGNELYNRFIRDTLDRGLNVNKFNIEYNIDYGVGLTAKISPPSLIVKTNRYSSLPYIYDYDTFIESELEKIIKFYKDIRN
jgi:hypothetical protein